MQGGPRPHLSVVRVPGKDRGLVTRQPIMARQFVCEYAGEVIGESGTLSLVSSYFSSLLIG